MVSEPSAVRAERMALLWASMAASETGPTRGPELGAGTVVGAGPMPNSGRHMGGAP